MYIDLHIELSSLIEFYNEQKSGGREVYFTPKEIYHAAKRSVLYSEISPFYITDNEKDLYYKRYKEYADNFNEGEVPDFFQHGKSFYDFENVVYVRSDVGFEHFSKLFILKILELHTNSSEHISPFLDFQLYDNFYGNREAYINYLNRVSKEVPNFFQLEEIVSNWIKKMVKRYNIPSDKTDWLEFLVSKGNYRIPSKLSDSEIKHFFTFLTDEIKGEGSYLKKEELDIIFHKGFIIPSEPLEKKIKLDYNTRRVKKVVDYGIHLLYKKNSSTQKDKNDYILFFAHYIEDYASALNSRYELELINSNMKGKRSSFWTIQWKNYLQE